LLGKLLAAQVSLETQLAELNRTGENQNLATECTAQLGALYALQNGIVAATATMLSNLRVEVTATVAASAVTVKQVQAALNSGVASESAQLAASSATTRRELLTMHSDLFERRIFDKYLTFTSEEDEQAYRRREAEGRRYIEQQLATNTPEGNLNAAGGTIDRMLDAHTHGAGDSPEFMPRWNRLVETTRNQRAALRQEGRSTEEFDRNLVNSVRRFLRGKDLSDSEIEARLATSADPLEAAKPYLKGKDDAVALGQSISLTGNATKIETQLKPSAASNEAIGEVHASLGELMATLKESGVTPTAQRPEDDFTHGVAVRERQPSKSQRSIPS
jgi:hypothetical protein